VPTIDLSKTLPPDIIPPQQIITTATDSTLKPQNTLIPLKPATVPIAQTTQKIPTINTPKKIEQLTHISQVQFPVSISKGITIVPSTPVKGPTILIAPPLTQPIVEATNIKELKEQISKEIRKPTKNYDELFKLLNQLKINNTEKKAYINDLKGQAQRFKKQSLITKLESYEKTIPDK